MLLFEKEFAYYYNNIAMKKLGRCLLTLALSAPLLSGCSFLSIFSNLPEETKDVYRLDLRDYTQSVTLNSKYNFDGKVYIMYKDDTEKEITEYCSFRDVDTSKIGKSELRVDYETKSKIYYTVASISVYDPNAKSELESISVSNYTDTVEKGAQYTFDGKVYAKYKGVDSPIQVNNSDCNIGSISTTTTGTKLLSISFTDKYNDESGAEHSVTKTATANINVIQKPTAISSSSLEVGVNRSKQIQVTFTPSDTTEKDVTYVSSNPAVASVDDNGNVTGKTAGQSATITVTSRANSSVKTTVNVNVVDIQQDKWTILIYMCGADLESKDALASMDLDEMKSVKGQPEDVNVVVQTGGASAWNTSGDDGYGTSWDVGVSISSSYNQRYELRNKSYTLKNSKVYSSYKSMGDPTTLKDFLNWGLEEYPAEKVGLILWNHGGGLYGACFDEKKDDDSLTNDEVVTALSSSNLDKKLEFIGYDCCLMQMMEVAEFNAPYANYQIASEESESGYGWDYDTWLDDVYADKSTETILKAIVDGFIADNGGVNETGGYYQGQYYPADQTLSYLDLSKIADFKTAWEAMASQLKSKATSNKSSFKSLVENNVQGFSLSSGYPNYDCYDLLLKLESNSTFNPGSTYITNAKNALNAVVKYSLAQKEASSGAYGLACYCGSGYDSSFTNFTNWHSLVYSVYGGGWY